MTSGSGRRARSRRNAAWRSSRRIDDDRIIAGQGTVGLEIVEDLPDVAVDPRPDRRAAGWRAASRPPSRPFDRTSGSSVSSRNWPRTPANRSPVARSSAGRRRMWAERSPTGRGPRRSADAPSAHLRAHLDEIVTVTETEIVAGVRLAAERSRLVVEPSGALTDRGARLPLGRARPGRRRWRRWSPSSVAATWTPSAYRGLPGDPAAGLTVEPADSVSPVGALVGQPLGQALLADPDGGHVLRRDAIGPRGVALLGSHPAVDEHHQCPDEDRDRPRST